MYDFDISEDVEKCFDDQLMLATLYVTIHTL